MKTRRESRASNGAGATGVWMGLLLAGLFCVLSAPTIAAEDASAEGKTAPVPVRLDRAQLAGLELTEHPPMPKEIMLEGSNKHRGHVFFHGEEIVVEVWEAETAKLSMEDPFPYDEFVLVLSGKLILTDARGSRTEYVAGDSLVVPKGFTGVWEMIGDYRELVVIEKNAYEIEEPTQ